MDLFYDFVR